MSASKLSVSLLIALAALVAAPPALSGGRFRTTSSFGYSETPPAAFLGQVDSPAEECIPHREVKVFRQRSGRPDLRLGSDRTSSTGQWIIEQEISPARYYAKVMARLVPRSVCGRYRTSTLRFP